MAEEFERVVVDGGRQIENLRREAKRWRDAALTARCGLDIQAGTFKFDRGMASIMSRALEENAAEFDRQAEEVAQHLQRVLADPVAGEATDDE